MLKGQYQQDVVGDLWWFSSDEYQHDGDDGIYAKLMIFKRMTIVIYICDEYQQDGDRVVVKTVVTVSVCWDQTGWRKISSFERQKKSKTFSPENFTKIPN